MPVAKITGQGLTSMAILVVLLWACVIGERRIVARANVDAAQTFQAMRSLQNRSRQSPAGTPAAPGLRRARPQLG